MEIEMAVRSDAPGDAGADEIASATAGTVHAVVRFRGRKMPEPLFVSTGAAALQELTDSVAFTNARQRRGVRLSSAALDPGCRSFQRSRP